MRLVGFLNNLFKKGGFVLIDANSKKYIIGSPDKSKPLTLKLLNKDLHYKLLINPDLYFGEAYMDGSLVIENGSITEFLELAFQNIGRGEINSFGYILKKIKGTFRYLTNFNSEPGKIEKLSIFKFWYKLYVLSFKPTICSGNFLTKLSTHSTLNLYPHNFSKL